jgi:negative regulator of flagellin synthesis FlgM
LLGGLNSAGRAPFFDRETERSEPMDRIDTQAPKGLAAGRRVNGAAPVAGPETARAGISSAKPEGAPVTSVVSAGGEPPIDHERVMEIRKAVEQGHYPLVPARIADAMIASGFMLRMRG